MPFKARPKPVAAQQVVQAPAKPVITPEIPKIEPKPLPIEPITPVEPVKPDPKPRNMYDFGSFVITALSSTVGVAFNTTFDPASAARWDAYISSGWEPLSFNIHPRESRIIVLFRKTA